MVIINEAMARKFWPKGDPLNDRVEIGAGMGPVFVEPPRQVIGVVGDTRDGGLNQDPGPTMYIPVAQMPDKVTALNSRIAPLWWIVRTRMEPHTLTAAVTNAIREATGGLPVAHIRSMDEIVVLTTRASASTCCCSRSSALRRSDGGDRHLWINGLLGAAADPGTRRQHGTGSTGFEHSQHGDPPGNAAGGDWARHRDRRSILADEISDGIPVWSKEVGSDGIHSDADLLVRGGANSSLAPSEKSNTGRSDFSVTV